MNPHFRNAYADLPAVIDSVKEALNGNGITYLQTGSPSADGQLHPDHPTAARKREMEVEDTATCPLPKADPQGFGSAMTYLRRYSLAAICGLYQDDDDGRGRSSVPKAPGAPDAAKTPKRGKAPLSPSTVPVPWQDYAIHFGKNKGVILGQLNEENPDSLVWYAR